MIRFLILGLLRHGARLHGYALVKAYRERSGTVIGSGNFYRELQRLVRDNLVRAAASAAEVDARRMQYEITDRGIAAFDVWLSNPDASFGTEAEDEISARALFLPEAEPSVALALLTGLKDGLWLWSRRLERERHRHSLSAQDAAPCSADAVLALLLARRQKYAAADLDLVESLSAMCAAARTSGATLDPTTPHPVKNTKPARRPAAPLTATRRAKQPSAPRSSIQC
jgi:DNA-binding PadR family transcriptional regulator